MILGTVRVRPLSGWYHKSEAFQDQNFSLKIYPHHPLYHMPLPKSQKESSRRSKSHWGSWSSWGSSLIVLSLGFTVTRVLFRFLINRILFRVLNDRVFFESSEIGSYYLRYTVIYSSLHQCSFSVMPLFFIKSSYYFSYQKQMFCFASIIILKNN